ncbi:aminoglycoside phosphotransferase family protein [Paenibacillus sp. YN15]|uniref:aminoglycoside phosphotransferase family protein n=1 Tax=Paenibacillus sp. YN15 TaxID=1742774 RepID=UPI000DCD890E|nr:aminoglycoside phosphotransferase family protein [Paenibacillus sp. YN15]RAV01740.1 aminoglycoside resistance protein [Paenibacillus sp. YN15]
MYNFTPEEAVKIEGRFGKAFYDRLGEKLDRCAERWELKRMELLPSFSANCVFTCESAAFGKAILKLGPPGRERSTEASALQEYNGGRFCRLYTADLAEGAILEERILPGTPLRAEQSTEKRLSVYSGLVSGLHKEPSDPGAYPSYLDWVSRIAYFMQGQEDFRELSGHMQRAEALCRVLWAAYPRRLLLHGDLHHDNILLGEGGAYRIIDPKGVVGDPVFDVPRFILNEMDETIAPDTYGRLNTVIVKLTGLLNIPEAVIRQCLYIETAMSQCWNVESGMTPSMDHVELAEALMAEAGANPLAQPDAGTQG